VILVEQASPCFRAHTRRADEGEKDRGNAVRLDDTQEGIEANGVIKPLDVTAENELIPRESFVGILDSFFETAPPFDVVTGG
jgi:hypothetical protein